MLGGLLTACQQDRPSPPMGTPTVSERKEAATFQDAIRDPQLRQAYIDRMAKGWKNECFAGFVYDPTGEKQLEETKSRLRYYDEKGLGHLIPEKRRKWMLGQGAGSGKQFAGTVGIYLDYHGGYRPLLFFGEGAFTVSRELGLPEAYLKEVVTVHEATHACDLYKGIKVGGRSFSYEELTEANEVLSRYVVELRAYGEQVKRYRLGSMKRYQKGFLLSFFKYFDLLLVNEIRLSDALDYFNGRMPSRMEAIGRVKENVEGPPNVELLMARLAIMDYAPVIARVENEGRAPWKFNLVTRIKDGVVYTRFPIKKAIEE